MPAPERSGAWGTPILAALALGVVLTAVACQPSGPSLPQPPHPPPHEEHLIEATERLVSFLRGVSPFESSLFADSVTLYVAPEGGGGSRRVAGPELRSLSVWRVGDHRLTPPPEATKLTRRAGRHFNCLEYPLASRYEALAARPHVGTKLEPPGYGSCLQSWNMTFVFAADSSRPVLTAVVYDQWEW